MLAELISILNTSVATNGEDYDVIKEIVVKIEEYEKRFFLEKQILLPNKQDTCEPFSYINKFLSDKKYLADMHYDDYFYISQKINTYERNLSLYTYCASQYNYMAVEQYKIQALSQKALKHKNDIINSIASSKGAVKKGITEDFFYNYLNEVSDFEIYKSYRYGYYYPDLIIVDTETNICIDIEIDEPYSFEDKKPIHFGDEDCNRDTYLIESGFFVIRFSEEQIVNNTYECHLLLKGLLKEIKNFISVNDFISVNEIYKSIKTRAWNYNEASNMAIIDARKIVLQKILA